MLICLQIHWMLWYYVDLEFDAQKILAETATGGLVGIAYAALPTLNQRYLRVSLRRVVAQPRTLVVVVIAIGAILITGVALNRTRVRWPAGQAEVWIDDTQLTSEKWTDATSNSLSVLGTFLRPRMLRVGDFTQTVDFRPFVPLTYDVPEFAVFSTRGEYRHITRLLALSFYQLIENHFLSEARTRLATDEGKKYVDLAAVRPIVELCFNGTDVARSGDTLLGALQQNRPASPWIPLLQACLHYARGEFGAAVVDLSAAPKVSPPPPLRNTAVFFGAVNLLRDYILRSNRGDAADPSLLEGAIARFREAGAMAEGLDDPYFKEISRGSANIFRGISFVYKHDNDAAFEAFEVAAKSSYPEIQARALSDLGYVALLRGSLADARTFFTKALEVDRKFPYARTNLGYLLLAEGRYDEARDLFIKLTNDDELRKESLRDIILSELAVAHIDAEKGGVSAPNPAAYDAPLKELGIFDYGGTAPPLLRLVQIRLALADRIYMSHDYYGLEMFALAMYARANAEGRTMPDNAEAMAAADRAVASFRIVSRTIDPRCFIFHARDGFFGPVGALASELRGKG